MRISITGDLGSGKSTIAKDLSEQLGIRCLSTGHLQRKIAQEYGVDSLKLNEISRLDETIDRKIDGYLESLSQSNEDLIIDSRMAWHFVKNTFRVYLQVHPEVAAERVVLDRKRTSEPTYENKESAVTILRARKRSENQRFFEKYGLRCDDLSNYDVVINTSDSSVASSTKLILRLLEQWLNQTDFQGLWISPKFLFPTEHVRSLARPDAQLIQKEIAKHGFRNEFPIECIKYRDYYFIWDGHKRVSGALFNKEDFVPVSLLAQDYQEIHKGHTAAEFAKSNFKLSWCYDWEEAHRFTFIIYPDLLTVPEELMVSDAV